MPQLVWIVTGTATGIGAQLVHAILDRGDKVIATARKASDRLKAQEDAGTAILDLDVTALQMELDAKVNEALKIYGRIDVLVNNAAYIEAGFLRRLGAVLCLKDEVAVFGIKTCTLITGNFRTEILSPQKIVYRTRDIPDYVEANKRCEAAVASLHQNQPGDPKAAAILIVDAVRSEGEAAGKELPSILPLGQDGLDNLRKRCRSILETCDEWETFSRKTTTQHLQG